MGDDDVLLTKQQVADWLAISRRTLDRMTEHGEAPPHLTLPSGRRRWRKGDVRAWLESRRGHP